MPEWIVTRCRSIQRHVTNDEERQKGAEYLHGTDYMSSCFVRLGQLRVKSTPMTR
ncbi:hypothetical protein Bpfe_025519, partial [Biomphalaria pfeifferi]